MVRAQIPVPFISRRGFVAAAALAAVGTLGACTRGSEGADTGSVPEGVLCAGIARPGALDPYLIRGAAAEQVAFQLFDPLTQCDFAARELAGSAAYRFEASDDARTFTFHLRARTFHDGEAVTAGHFKRSWERLVSPDSAAFAAYGTSPNAYRLSLVEGYEALAAGETRTLSGVACPDDDTLVVTLVEPYADFPHILSHPSLAAVPDAAEDDLAAFDSNPIGAGPFAMERSWGKNSTDIRLTRYEGYAAGSSAVTGVRFMLFSDEASAYQEFLTGSLDVASCPVDELEGALARYGRSADGITAKAGARLVQSSDLATSYLALNCATAPFDVADVRRAVSLAIDRQSLVDRVYRDMHRVADGIVPPQVFGYREGAWAYVTHDPSQARSLLDEVLPADAQGRRSDPVSLLYQARGGHENAIDQIVDNLGDIGIEVEPVEVEAETFFERLRSGNYQMARLDAVTDRPTLESILFPLFHTRSQGGSNVSAYGREEVDALIDQARSETDADARATLLQQAESLVAEDMPVVPLTYPTHAVTCSPAADGLVIDPEGMMRFTEVPEAK